MQTILGAGGAIGTALSGELKLYDTDIRLVSRNPKKVNESDELFAGDITDASVVDKAVEGSDVTYLTAGLQYKFKVWQEQWPLIMRNTINACKKHKSKLVFFDNVYMYDPDYLENLTEETPVRPVSKKGKVRAEIAAMLLSEIESENLEGMIVRSADFYGPGVNSSVMMETGYKKLKAGKKPMWIGNPKAFHSMTFVPDAAKATALLGNTPDAYRQIWHLPTEDLKLTGAQWTKLFAGQMGRPPKFSSISGGMIRFLGLFAPFFRELGEMMYQFDNNYFFNCEKFKSRFPDFLITPPEEGVRQTVEE